MKRKHLFIISTIALLSFASISFIQEKGNKEFIGVITYSVQVESKNTKLPVEVLKNGFGTQMVLYRKNGNYKICNNGNDLKDVYYLKTTNTEYTLRKKADTLYTLTFDKEERSLKSSKIIDTTVIVAGRKCKIFEAVIDDIKYLYYFDPSLYLDPQNYKNCKTSYLNLYYEKAKSPWIKYEYHGKNFNYIYTATKIEEKELDNAIFELPKFPMTHWPK
jgi:hypothetical protein